MNFKILIAIIMFNFYITILPMDDMRQIDLNKQLSDAVGHNDIAKVNELLTQGTDPNYEDYETRDWSLLYEAVFNGRLDIVQTLLDHGANPNYKTGLDETPLQEAVFNGHLEIVQTLLDHGSNPNYKTYKHEAPLHLAAKKGYSAIVLALLRKGAAINALDKYGQTPLLHAAENGHSSTIDIFFMKKGADVNAQNCFGTTPLIKAVEYKGHDSGKIVQKLLNFDANVHIKDKKGETVLHKIARYNKVGMEILLTKYPDPLVPNYKGKKARDLAKYGSMKEMLTKYEADYHRQNLENLKIFSQELQKKRGYKPGYDYQALSTETSKYL